MPEELQFNKGDWVIDVQNPGRPGIFTGNIDRQDPFTLVELEYGPGDRCYRPLVYLEPASPGSNDSLEGCIRAGRFGKLSDLQRLLTFEKLKGTLHEMIYSMEAAEIDFYPYQFKPVVKFINSPTERMVIADEVGLGKTIEAALIWLELQARKQARRLLVVCPTQILARKWQNELRDKFIIDARLAKSEDLRQEIKALRNNGASHPFVLISTYSGLRPNRDEIMRLRRHQPVDDLSPKTGLCVSFSEWDQGFDCFDLVIFDEAHHMRNPATSNHYLGESLSSSAGAVLCVSATPVNNSNRDLHSILQLIDDEFFRSQVTFGELLEANKPAVQLTNAIARTPVDLELLQKAIKGLGRSPFVSRSPLFQRLLDSLEHMDFSNPRQLAEFQTIAEKLNLLGGYVTRTRRAQVQEHRPVREPVVLQVEYEPMEMRFYRAILGIVRRRCEQNDKPFYPFQVIGLQMRAASSLPVLASELKSGKLGEPHDLLMEGFGDLDDSIEDIAEDDSFSLEGVSEFLSYDFEEHDSKYKKLEKHILCDLAEEKILLFSFYRGTLNYLETRLRKAGVAVVLIHGGIKHEDRKDIVDDFNSEGGARVLISSEVGSEGIDMHQNCRCLINYDLPWNPMRVEQRIGRIDRVGQTAPRLSVIHLKVKDTIEERIYDRLHQRLELFANSLGDLESVIGNEVKDLTLDLLRKDLSPEEEEQRIEESERIVQLARTDLQLLDESGDSLIALSDYLQKKINEDRGKGRFIQPEELETYLRGFFEREFRGTTIDWNTPMEGCLLIRLSSEAQASLSEFIRDDRSLSARPLRQSEFSLTFRKGAHKQLKGRQRRQVHFANHLSPLVRWMTRIYANGTQNFFRLSAMQLALADLPEGIWLYRVERWLMKGLRNQEQLAYAIIGLDSGQILDSDDAERIIQKLLYDSQEWDYPEFDLGLVVDRHEVLVQELSKRFDETILGFIAENSHTCQIRKERARYLFDRRINQIQTRLDTMKRNRRSEKVIRPMETQLKNALANKAMKLSDLKGKENVDPTKSEVAAGIFIVGQGA